jgi:type IV pilus assembly protein PilP
MIFSLSLLLYSLLSLSATESPSTNFFNDKTKIDNPFNLRDPFKAPPMRGEKKKKTSKFSPNENGEYSNISEPALDQLQVSQIRLVGVLIGRERRAMISASNSGPQKIIVLKEGMKIGQESAELKAILPGGIVLVEKIVNVYGEEEFLETVIPISK